MKNPECVFSRIWLKNRAAIADLKINSYWSRCCKIKTTPSKLHAVDCDRHTNLWTKRVFCIEGALVLHLLITSSRILQAKHAGEFSQVQQHPGTLCSILCLTEHCLSSNAALIPHPCWTTAPPLLPLLGTQWLRQACELWMSQADYMGQQEHRAAL